jgi:hypothetical protein
MRLLAQAGMTTAANNFSLLSAVHLAAMAAPRIRS